jgi:hypothetical protein
MRGIFGIVVSVGMLGLVGCVEMQVDETVSADDSALTVTSTGPVVVSTIPSMTVLPTARDYDTLRAGFDYVPSGCHFLAFVTYSAGTGRYMTTGVCTRPRFVAWRVYGDNRGDFPAMMTTIRAQVASTALAYQNQAATTGVVFDFGTGGSGDFGKIGPAGGGPVGPGPVGPGGDDPVTVVLDYLYGAAAEVDAAHVGTPIGGISLPGTGVQPAP